MSRLKVLFYVVFHYLFIFNVLNIAAFSVSFTPNITQQFHFQLAAAQIHFPPHICMANELAGNERKKRRTIAFGLWNSPIALHSEDELYTTPANDDVRT